MLGGVLMRKGIIVSVLMLCLLMTGCVSNAKYEELETRVENLERIHGIENSDKDEKNESSNNAEVSDNEYATAKSINLLYEFDPETNSWRGDYYQLRLEKDKCTLQYHSQEPFEETYTDYSVDKYYEVLNLVCSQPLEKYENKVDDNGKIIYETVPCMLGLYMNGSEGTIYFKTPANMDEIIAKFESMK